MRRTAQSINTIGNRFNPANDYFHIPLHEQSGADIAIVGQLDGTAFSTTATLQGSPADTVWTGQTGWYENEGDNYAFLEAVTQVASIMTPANYSAGGILFLIGVWLDSGRNAVSESASIIQYGERGTTNGGYSIELGNGSNANFTTTYYPKDGSGVNTSKQITAKEDQFIPGFVYFDFADRTGTTVNATSNLASASTLDIGSDALLSDIPANFDIGFNCRVGTGPAASNILNGTANINWKQHDLWCVGFDTPPTSAKLQEILTEWVANPYENITSIP